VEIVAQVVSDIMDDSEPRTELYATKEIDQGYAGDREEEDLEEPSNHSSVDHTTEKSKKPKRPRLGAKQRQKIKEKKVPLQPPLCTT